MDSLDRAVLFYLKSRGEIAIDIPCLELASDFPDSDIRTRIFALIDDGFIHGRLTPSNQVAQIRITPKGLHRIDSVWKRFVRYVSNHWIEILTLALSAAIFALTLMSLLTKK
jgi:hypothetical protein